jgi:membrane-associated phospholipid phosphatase
VSASPHGSDGHGPEAEVAVVPEADAVVRTLPAPAAPHGITRRRIRDQITRRALVIAGLLTVPLVYILVDIFVEGPLTRLDVRINDWNGQQAIPSLDQAAWVYDKLGQRSVLVPILLLVAVPFARKNRSWRPVVLACMSFLVLNVVVGAMKIVIGRSQTETGNPAVLQGDIIFPSGHSSNMVLTGGVIVYLFWRYAQNPPLRRIAAGWAVLTTLTCLTSLYIGSHWLTDLIAGALVGGLLLQSVILFDIATKDIRYTRPWWWRKIVGLLPFLEMDRHGVDAVPVAGGRAVPVVEDVPEVGAAPGAADLRSTHAE